MRRRTPDGAAGCACLHMESRVVAMGKHLSLYVWTVLHPQGISCSPRKRHIRSRHYTGPLFSCKRRRLCIPLSAGEMMATTGTGLRSSWAEMESALLVARRGPIAEHRSALAHFKETNFILAPRCFTHKNFI